MSKSKTNFNIPQHLYEEFGDNSFLLDDCSKRTKVNWVCPDYGHNYSSILGSRLNGSGCPFCSGVRVLSGFNDFASRHPDVAKLWDYVNNTITPDTVPAAGGSFKAWFSPICGHSVYSNVSSAIKTSVSQPKKFCHFCANREVLTGFNDLETLYPDLLSIYDYSRNNGKKPHEQLVNNKNKIDWICKEGHTWNAIALKHKGCPTCNGRGLVVGFNDIFTTHPHLKEEWSDKNTVDPLNIKANYRENVFWECKEYKHEWQIAPLVRTYSNHNCPVCANVVVLAGFNDLSSQAPSLADEWHPTKNGSLKPNEVYYASTKKFWWLGDCGHSFKTKISSRFKKGVGCIVCSYKKRGDDLARRKPEKSLRDERPMLAQEWHPTKNGSLSPDDVSPYSMLEAWWLCPKEKHEYKTYIKRRGTKRNPSGCPICLNKKVVSGVNDALNTHPNLIKFFSDKNVHSLTDVVAGNDSVKFLWKCPNNHCWEESVFRMVSRVHPCVRCANYAVSKGESEVADYIESILDIPVLRSVRSFKGIQELDIYIPDKKIAIEFNGVYWHSEAAGRGERYHYDKWKSCNDLDIQLIQVWEDDWKYRRSIVQSLLAYKLGVFRGDRVFARDTSVCHVSSIEAEKFLNDYHIQGNVDGSIRIGLRFGDALIAVMVFRREEKLYGSGSLLLARFASSASVVGGFSKLLKFIENDFNPSRIVSFSDNSVSNGGLYINNGFVIDKRLAPNYMYVVGDKRKHKFSFRYDSFKNDPSLLWFDGMSEFELADVNGLNRVWDSGKVRWVKVL